MSKSWTQLIDLYTEWRRLTVFESEAIESLAWDQVDSFQNEKIQLQHRIIDAQEEWQNSRSDSKPTQGEIRSIIAELLELERVNSESITAKKAVLSQKQAELGRTQRNIRQIQQSYSASSGPRWNSYG